MDASVLCHILYMSDSLQVEMLQHRSQEDKRKVGAGLRNVFLQEVKYKK